jgi:hypothetical protein
MDRITDSLEGVFAYLDNSLVGSPDRQTHLHHLEEFFKALAANDLAINLEKCVFATLSLEILGHTIRRQERPPRPITPPKSKIAHPLRISNNRNVSLAWYTFTAVFCPSAFKF